MQTQIEFTWGYYTWTSKIKKYLTQYCEKIIIFCTLTQYGRKFFEDTHHGRYKRYYLDEGIRLDDVWTYLQDGKFRQLNSQSKERTGYPTQKPLSLLERIIKASCPENGVVLDPFCGCATTCVASEKLGKKWIGIDISIAAYELVKQRLAKEVEGWREFLHVDHKADSRLVWCMDNLLQFINKFDTEDKCLVYSYHFNILNILHKKIELIFYLTLK